MEFRAILETLVETYPLVVLGAIFCDSEGERVDSYRQDQVSNLSAYDLDLLGAAYATVVKVLRPGASMRVVHEDRVIWIATVEGGYYLLAVCAAPLSGAVRDELPRAVAALAAHM